MFCSKCGRKNPENARYCRTCGAPRAAAVLPTAVRVHPKKSNPGDRLESREVQGESPPAGWAHLDVTPSTDDDSPGGPQGGTLGGSILAMIVYLFLGIWALVVIREFFN